MEHMQNELAVDSLPPAIAYETKVDHRRCATSIQSNVTTESVDSEVDVEILMNDLEPSDSPAIAIRKRLL
jgi:hypothetical protein